MDTRSSRRIAVVGGGLGGLAAAATLAARGHQVVLVEKNPWLGGKAAVLSECGYRFDMGPTILTLPSVLRRVLAEAGWDLEDHLDLVRLDPQWRCFFEGGTTLDLIESVDRMAVSVQAFARDGRSGEGYRRLLEASRRLHDISERFFFWRPLGSLRDMFRFGPMFRPSLLGDLLQLRLGRTVAGTIRSMVPDPRVAQMLDHFTQYVGSAPDASPAVLCGIAHMQSSEGVWYPMGGTRAVAEVLEKLVRVLGVELRLGVGVRQIHLEEGRRVRGVELETGEMLRVQAVVSNADSVRTHRELIGGGPARRFARRRSCEPACSGVVLYLGLDRRYPQLEHHNFVFSRSPEEELSRVFRDGEPAEDPTCYVCAPARTEPAVAPPGGEALYVLVHAPSLRPHHDWKRMLPAYRDVILRKLERVAGLEGLTRSIRFERALTPRDINDRYRVLDGAIYGLSSHGRFLGAFKPSNRSPDVEGLYLAGGSAHPGPGMPMVIMSGWIAADALHGDLGGQEQAPQVVGAGSRNEVTR